MGSLVAVAIVAATANAQSASHHLHSKARIYSNVQYIEEGAGDLVGTELILFVSPSRVYGLFKDYEGPCTHGEPVSGSVGKGTLHLSGTSTTYGKVEIEGSITDKQIKATLQLEKASKPQAVVLKRISKGHC